MSISLGNQMLSCGLQCLRTVRSSAHRCLRPSCHLYSIVQCRVHMHSQARGHQHPRVSWSARHVRWSHESAQILGCRGRGPGTPLRIKHIGWKEWTSNLCFEPCRLRLLSDITYPGLNHKCQKISDVMALVEKIHHIFVRAVRAGPDQPSR